MMTSLYRRVTKTPTLRLSCNYSTSKFWAYSAVQPQAQAQGAVAMEENTRLNNWRRPSEIPFQSKVANWVNLIGKIRMPVRFLTLPNGDSWAGTLLSHHRNNPDSRLFWIPIIFEGDMAHTASMHLKVQDIVHVAGQLTPDPLPINLTNDRADIQMVRTTRGEEQSSRKRKGDNGDKGKGKAGSPSRQTRGNNPFNLEGVQFERYLALSKRNIIPTRYMNEPFLQTTGMLDDVEWLLNRKGVLDFTRMRDPTYRNLTLEVLSTFDVNLRTQEGRITFRIDEEEHNLTLAQFAQIFRLLVVPDNGTKNLIRRKCTGARVASIKVDPIRI